MEIDARGSEKSLSFCCLKIDNIFCVSRLTREGSGSLLLKYAKLSKGVKFYGQEINLTTYNLARINMFLHNIGYDKFDIKLGDTLLDPKHNDDKPFDAIVSNPPYSTKWEGKSNPLLANDERFHVTQLAPKGKADFAFVLHILHNLSSSGTAAIVMFPGTLYRDHAEQDIRKYLVDNVNVVDSVIQLPDNLFFGTSISTCIIVLRKNKNNNDNANGILFVDASKEFVKSGIKNKLTNTNIKKIVDTIRFKKEVTYFSKLVSREEVKNKNYNLSVNTYVEKEDTSEKIDIKLLNMQIKEIVAKIEKLRKEIDEIVLELEE